MHDARIQDTQIRHSSQACRSGGLKVDPWLPAHHSRYDGSLEIGVGLEANLQTRPTPSLWRARSSLSRSSGLGGVAFFSTSDQRRRCSAR